MTKVVLLLMIALLLFLAARWLRNTALPCKRRGVLDDDGTQRGERWDGSWLSAPRTALSPA